MAQCVSSPTRTSTGVGSTRSVSTTTTRFVTTPPGSVSTSIFATCSTVTNTSTICETTSRLVTQPGVPFTTTGQLAVTVDVPYTFTTTLYGSSCTTPPGVVVSPTIISPVVSTVTTSSVYTSDGSTYITVFTSLTSAVPPQSTSDGASPPSTPANTNNTNSKIPAIVGGTVGGIAVLALLTFLAWKFFKKPPISFDKEDFANFRDSTKQEQAYQYTPVGQQDVQTVAHNDTAHHPATYGNDMGAYTNGVAGGDTLSQYTGATNNGVGPAVTGNEIAFQSGIPGNDAMYNVPNHGPVHQVPMPSLTPLATGAAATAVAGPAARPNSTFSSNTYMSGSDHTTPQMHYPPNMGYVPQQYPSHPSVLAPYPQQQPYGPPPMQHQTQRPVSHHPSVGSRMSMSSYGAIGSSAGPTMDAMPSLMIQPGQVFPHHQQPFAQPYGDSLSGSQSVGSAGPPESQVLQVMNPGPDTSGQDPSTTSGTPGLVVGPPPSTSSSPPPIDGKGRPLDTRGEKAAIVHLDGGAYGGESSTPAPPAYRE